MTRLGSKSSMFILLLLGLTACGWVEPQKADIVRIVGEQGFTDVRDVEPIFLGCDQHDAFRYHFTAISPKGNRIKGEACASFFKGWTIRFL